MLHRLHACMCANINSLTCSLHRRKMSGIVYCVDSSKRKSMRMARESLHDLLQRRHHDKGTQSPLLVFANKQDIKGAMTPKEVEDALNLHSIKDRPYRELVENSL